VETALTFPADLDERIARHLRFWGPAYEGEGLYVIARAPRAGWEKATRLDAAKPVPSSLHEQWLDVDFALRKLEYELASVYLGGDGLPIAMPNLGPGIIPGLVGHPFALTQRSIWFDQNPFDDPAALADLHFDPNTEFYRVYTEFNDRLLERAEGRYFVAQSDFGSCFDTLASLLRRDDLLAEVALDPARVSAWIGGLFGLWDDALRANRELISTRQPLQSNWIPLVNDRIWYSLISEVSSMISRQAYEEIALPALLREAAQFEQVIFNLDGDTAARHVDLVCTIPQLHAIFWAPTVKYSRERPFYQDLLAPESLAVCRTVQEHAKLLIDGIQPWQLADFLKQVSPDGLFLIVDCGSQIEAEEVLASLRRWIH
jgi:hypothetical protein